MAITDQRGTEERRQGRRKEAGVSQDHFEKVGVSESEARGSRLVFESVSALLIVMQMERSS